MERRKNVLQRMGEEEEQEDEEKEEDVKDEKGGRYARSERWKKIDRRRKVRENALYLLRTTGTVKGKKKKATTRSERQIDR